MRISFVNMPLEYFSPVSGGAISTIIRATSGELRAAGHEVDVISYVDRDNPADQPVVALGDFRARSLFGKARNRARRLAGPAYRRAVVRALRRLPQGPDALVVFNDYASPKWLKRAMPSARCVVWLQNDENVPDDVEWHAVDLVLACSDYIRDRAIARGVPPDRCRTAASGVDATAFVPREGWLTPPTTLKVLCMGRLDPNKGHDIAVSAVLARRREGQPIAVSLVGAKWWYGDGSDAYVDALLSAVAEAGGQYLGLVSRERMPSVVAQHDVCMVLSRSEEPFGLVVLEAMAAGLAVIASTRGGIPQACGGAALALLDPEDRAGLDRALASLSGPDGAQLLAAAKTASRRRAEEASWAATAAALLAGLAVG